MSKHHKQLQLYLFKNKLNERSLIDFTNEFSNETVKNIINDLGINISVNGGVKKKKQLYIFSDGNVKNNGKKNSRGGYSIYFGENKPYCSFNKTSLDESEPTNNKLELLGIKNIYKTIYKNQDIFKNTDNIICTDSQYSISCLTKWCDNWIKNNWKNSKNEEVKNKELIQSILIIKDVIPEDIKITFKHVYGHTKEPIDKDSLEYKLWRGNNKVDTDINKMLNTHS